MLFRSKERRGRDLTIATALIRHNGWNDIEVSFKDTGKGIPEEDLEKIFEPFFSTKEVGKGTGLGLYISRTLAHILKGNITVQDRLDGQPGSVFEVELPGRPLQ